MFIRNCWYVAAWERDLGDGTLFTIPILGEPIVIFKKDDGGFVALEDRCCHRFAPLSLGRIEDGCNLRCLYHGLKFDASGQCVEIPGQDKIPATARVRAYPVIGRHSWVWVWMGDPALADPDLIPAAVGFDDPAYILRGSDMDYVADYQLINDNLTDFSHLSYVHANSFGATDAWALHRPTVKRIARGIRVTRWLPSDEALKDGTPGMAATNQATAMWQTYDYVVPGVLLMYSATYPIDGMPEDRISPPEGKPLAANFTSQALTPMGEKSTRYYFSSGPRAVDGGADMAEAMFKIAQMAFNEDREMIEAQQRNIDLRQTQEVLTSADVGPIQMRSVIRQMFKAENGDLSGLEDEKEPQVVA